MAYKSVDTHIGTQDLATVDTVQRVPLGTEIRVWDSTYGEGRAVYLRVAKSTTNTAGLLYYANANLEATVVPAVSTSKKTGRAVYVALNAVASDASNYQYTWFLKKGITSVLKTAVQVTPDNAVYISTTAGRVYLTASAGAQIVGARTVNAATVTTTTSTVLVQIDNPCLQGYS